LASTTTEGVAPYTMLDGYRLAEGTAPSSLALRIAAQAGLPPDCIARAQQFLDRVF
jgi:dsDNA-specific endonuclease/ATPase MutS2